MASPVKTLCILRHPAFTPPAEPTCLGQTDVELKSALPAAWEKITAVAKDFQPQIILASDLKRCRIPAEHTAKFLELPLEILTEWREIAFGEWDGLPWSTIEQKWPETMTAWMKDFVNTRPPGGESMKIFHTRIGTALDHALSRPEDKILIITHSGVMRSIFCRIAEAPLQKAFSVEFAFCGLLKMENSSFGLRILL